VKILLDECVDQRFRRELSGHDVKTVQEMGWSGTKNGELLQLAQQEHFKVLLTVDRNLYFQQNVSGAKISVLVMIAKTNRLADLKPLVREVLHALDRVTEGEILEVGQKN